MRERRVRFFLNARPKVIAPTSPIQLKLTSSSKIVLFTANPFMFTGLCTWVCVPVKTKNEFLIFVYRFFENFGRGVLPPRPPGFWRGGQSSPRPPPKRSSAAFDRGGQTGPPRSNAFFSAPLTTRAPPTTLRPDTAYQKTPFLNNF